MKDKSEITLYGADHLISMAGEPLSPGALAVQGGKVLQVGDLADLQKRFPQAKVKIFSGGTLLPGLVDAHTDLSLFLYDHSPHPPVKSEDGQFHFMPWLVHLSQFKSAMAIPQQREAVQRGLEAMKRSGVTCLGDRCRYPSVLPLYQESGLRVLCLAEIENIQRRTAQEEFEQALAMVDEILHMDHPRLRAGYAPFSAYALSKNLLKILADHALQQRIPLHLFAALSFSEMEFFYDSLGEISAVLFKEAGWTDKIPAPHHMTPVQYLHEIGVLRIPPALVGCLHLGPTDSALLDHHACSRIFAPKAFFHLQVGTVPWEKVISEDYPWALATLGRAWGAKGDLWEEMRTVLYEASEEKRKPYAHKILEAATLGGARALGLESQVGSLSPGKYADFIVVASPEPEASLAAALIDQTRSDSVWASFVAGTQVYSAEHGSPTSNMEE